MKLKIINYQPDFFGISEYFVKDEEGMFRYISALSLEKLIYDDNKELVGKTIEVEKLVPSLEIAINPRIVEEKEI